MHTSTTADAAAQAQIKSAYEKFFSGKTSMSDRVAAAPERAEVQAGRPGASRATRSRRTSSVTVSSVTLQGADKAKVVYTVKLGGAALPKQTGTAVRQNGTWKVGDASLCRLVALQGSAPSVCKS